MIITDSYIKVIEAAIHWIQTQMLSFDEGYNGIYERIRIDRHERVCWTRPDCNAEYLRVLYGYRMITHNSQYLELEEKITAFLERIQDTDPLSVWKGSFPFFVIDGTIREKETGDSIYQNDNGKVLICLCQMYENTKDSRYLSMARSLGDYWIHCQQEDGTWGRKDGRTMFQCAKGPCFVIWMASGMYLLYEQTKNEQYLNSAQKAMKYLISLIREDGSIQTSYELIKMEDWRPLSSETCMSLYALVTAYKVTKDEKYLRLIEKVGRFVERLRRENGAIANCLEQNNNVSLQDNPDLCDLVYTQGHALFIFVELFEVTGNGMWFEWAHQLAGFLCEIQCRGESPLWDGGWRGSWNLSTGQWDGRANQNNKIDEGGMYSVYTGWCATTILYGLEKLILAEKRRRKKNEKKNDGAGIYMDDGSKCVDGMLRHWDTNC